MENDAFHATSYESQQNCMYCIRHCFIDSKILLLLLLLLYNNNVIIFFLVAVEIAGSWNQQILELCMRSGDAFLPSLRTAEKQPSCFRG